MRKEIRLYNVLFPLWMLLLLPTMWLIVLPANFIIDSIILLILMHVIGVRRKMRFYKKRILKVYFIGLFSDLIGSIYMLGMTFLGLGQMGDEWFITLPALLISAICIYLLNFYITFKKFDTKTKIMMSLTYAIVTAPYTFLVPSRLLYNF